MANRGAIKIEADEYQFAVVRFPQGLPQLPTLDTTELQSPGVDGMLVVNNGLLFRPFPVHAVLSYSLYNDAHAAHARLLASRRRFVEKLRVLNMGPPKQWKNLHILNISAIVRRDIGGGPFAASGQQAIIELDMLLRLTEGADGA